MARRFLPERGRKKKKRTTPYVRRFSDQYEKALFVLQAFTPGEIQAHTKVKVPYKTGRSKDSKKYKVVLREREVEGSGIPASTISRFQDGQYQLREGSTTVKKLAKMYKRFQEVQFRAYGADRKAAKYQVKTLTHEELKKALYQLQYNAKLIQHNYKKYQNKDIPLEHIQYGMSISRHKFSDWDKLAMISGIQKPETPKKGRSAKRSKKKKKKYVIKVSKAIKSPIKKPIKKKK